MTNPLKVWRTKAHVTQMGAAKSMKTSLASWKTWENGAGFPSEDNMAKLTKLTGVTRSQLETARG